MIMKNKIEELKIELAEMEDHYAFDPTDQDLHEDIIALQAQLKELEDNKYKNKIMKNKYILLKDLPRLGKEIGDYYNNEFVDSPADLIRRGIITPDKTDKCFIVKIAGEYLAKMKIEKDFNPFTDEVIEASLPELTKNKDEAIKLNMYEALEQIKELFRVFDLHVRQFDIINTNNDVSIDYIKARILLDVEFYLEEVDHNDHLREFALESNLEFFNEN